MKYYILFTFPILLLGLFGCKSSQKLVEQGSYDQAIENAINRLAGKKKKKAEEVRALEIAFEKATDQDMAKINRLKSEQRPENWERVYDIAQDIDRRQQKIQPLLPLEDEQGRKAKFRFVKINYILQEARSGAASHLYNIGQQYLAQARSGDKAAAREAYHQLNKIEQYYSTYKNTAQLKIEAREIGVSRILFRMENDAFVILPMNFEQEVLRMEVRDLNELWRNYYMQPKSNVQFDYEIIMKIQNIEVSPERINERTFQETTEIEDGEEVLKDDNGNTRKDSTGAVIKVPIKKIIRADVIEVYQTKAAIVSGTLYFFDRRTKRNFDTQPITAEAIFEHYASTYEGDRRALSKESKRRIGNRPVPFPTDEALILDAADVLKPIIKEKIERAGFF